jgi:hypothetical protein
MFVRFRQTQSTLQVSLLSGRRADGRVRHEQLASLGSVKLPLTIEGRDAFWWKLHDMLARLGNRLDAAGIAKVLGDVHARIPMVTSDERTADAIVAAERDQQIWDGMHNIFNGAATGMADMADKANAASAYSRKHAAEAAANSAAAKERIERLRRGEHVEASKPADFEKELRDAGFKTGDIQHLRQLADLPKDLLPAIRDEALRASRRAERAAVRRLWRKRFAQ